MRSSTISLGSIPALQKAPEGKEKCFVRGGRGRAGLCAAGRTGEEAAIPESAQRLAFPFPVPPESTEHDRSQGREVKGCGALSLDRLVPLHGLQQGPQSSVPQFPRGLKRR